MASRSLYSSSTLRRSLDISEMVAVVLACRVHTSYEPDYVSGNEGASCVK